MCAGAILQARIDTVVWGAPNKLLGADGGWIRGFFQVAKEKIMAWNKVMSHLPRFILSILR
ncbi:hypothetical protein OROGR_002030 [Orobanche gracilis]